MNIRRLGFAGLQLTAQDTSIVIDAVTSFGGLSRIVGEPAEPLPPPAPADLALVTHLHRDHADGDALRTAGVRRVLRPPAATGEGLETIGTAEGEDELDGFEQQVVGEWETVTHGPFTITAVPAADGFGEPQVSWVVEADGTRIVHAGDTIFHGWWWLVPIRCGPVDLAFLPVNGAITDFPNRQPPSPLPACMDPHQAAVAASLLGARRVVPIHYGAIRDVPQYEQVDDPAGALTAAAHDAGVEALVVAPGDPVPKAPGS